GEDEIVAITGATITSKAVTLGVNEAIKFYDTKLKGGK
ncbi:FMN-binding protein, partial [Clostridium beijerinckii]